MFPSKSIENRSRFGSRISDILFLENSPDGSRMTFLMRKKKYKFVVSFTLEELSSVPFVTGQIFVKCRLLEGGSFHYISPREEVKDHKVKWNSKFDFNCKMSANPSNGILDSTLLRLSVRKEVKGGRSSQKLGFVELDLAEFAGSGQITKRYLLEGYDNKNSRQDNSTLKVTIEMTLLCGDPLFKRPLSSTMPLYPPLYRNDSLSEVTTNILVGSGGGGRGDKTNSLDGDGLSSLADGCPNSAIDDETSTQLKLDIRDIPLDNDCYSTRIDSVQLINQLVEETNLERFNSPDDQEIGLKLIVSKDGTTSLASGT